MMTSVPSFSATSNALSTTGVGGSPTPDDDGIGVTSATSEPPDCHLSSNRLTKRPLVGLSSLDQCKKRRKQSMPVRISNTEQDNSEMSAKGQEVLLPSTSTTPPPNLRDHPVAAISAAAAYLATTYPTSPAPDKRSPSQTTPPPAPPVLLNFSRRSPTPSITQQQALLPPSPKSFVDTSANVVDLRSSTGPLLTPWITEQSPLKQTDQPDWIPLSNLAMATSAPLYMPHPELQSQARNPSQPSIRIFNPEAYCELCNKEFCNKYFLKTHKANKHRIYSDPPVSDINIVNMPNFASSPTATTPPHMKKSSITVNVDLMKNEYNKTSETHSCEICNKIFSYKILLKTHKKCVHGICEPETAFNYETENSEKQVLKVDEQEPGQIENFDEESIQQTSISSLFKNGMPQVDVSLVKEETYPDQDESLYTATNASKMSPASFSGQSREMTEQINNRLRRIGIMNPEAFCEICCKEYCNKYFLRTHKMKRHGILIPDDGVKDPSKPESHISNNWYQIQTSPLNLIMGEQNTNSSGSCSERKASPTNEHACEVCGLRFQTAQLAMLHVSTNCRGKPFDLQEAGHKTDSVNNNSSNHENFSSVINADTISEDLKKLQSMILQLNNLNDNKNGPVSSHNITCNLCNKEFENRYLLQSHVIGEHNMFADENFEDRKERESELIGEKMFCKICGRDGFTSIENFKQHKIECHNVLLTETAKEDSVDMNTTEGKTSNQERKFPAGISTERRSSVSLTPTSSYCEICNKELCNKYFMKTHMQRMHGIEIENGAQIGGVVCNICNKELCSKYFLRVHKHNTHGIVEEGTASNSGQSRPMTGEIENIPAATPQSELTDSSLKPDLADLSHRYFSHFSEVCSICSRRFRSTKWLKAHLLGDHGKLGTEKWNELELQLQQTFGQQNRGVTFNKSGSSERLNSPMLKIPNGNQTNAEKEKTQNVQNVLSSLFGSDESNAKQYFCSFCSFSTPVLAFLFVHERSHTRPEQDKEQGNLQCVVCSQSFPQPELLQHHVLSQHPFLPVGQHFVGGIERQLSIEKVNQQNLVCISPKMKSDGDDDNDEPQCREQADQSHSRDRPPAIEQSCSRCKCKGGSFVSEDGGLSLKEVSNQSNLPATYALPQSAVIATKYVMQAFLMDEPRAAASDEQTSPESTAAYGAAVEESDNNGVSPDADAAGQQVAGGDRKFAPSIVFLPVRERLNTPLTVSFTLTPT